MDQSVGQIFQGIVEGSQKLVAEKVDAAGKRPKIKVIVGGAPVAEDFARSIGADGYAPDSMWNFKGPFGMIEHGGRLQNGNLWRVIRLTARCLSECSKAESRNREEIKDAMEALHLHA